MTSHRTNGNAARTVALARLAIIAGAALAFLALAGFARETLRNRQIAAEVAGLRAEAERLEARNFEIASLRRSLESGEFVEREARTKLGMRKEGEMVVVLTRPEAHAAQPSLQPAPAEDAWSNPKKWLIYFADRAAFQAYAGR